MQEVRHDGSKGPITPFDKDEMAKMLGDVAVKEVRVFKTLPDTPPDDPEIKEEKKELEQQPPPQKQPPRQIPKVIKEFLLQKGMRINLHGTLYKVTAARSNRKVTMKFVKFIEK